MMVALSLPAACAVQTTRIAVRAGSVVLPLENPLRVVEERAMNDNFPNGRVAIATSSGWQVNGFVLSPHTYQNRYHDMFRKIVLIQKLWRGEAVTLLNGARNPHRGRYPARAHPEGTAPLAHGPIRSLISSRRPPWLQRAHRRLRPSPRLLRIHPQK